MVPSNSLMRAINWDKCSSSGKVGCPELAGWIPLPSSPSLCHWDRHMTLNCSQWGGQHLGWLQPPIGVCVCTVFTCVHMCAWASVNGWTRGHCKVLCGAVMGLEKCHTGTVLWMQSTQEFKFRDLTYVTWCCGYNTVSLCHLIWMDNALISFDSTVSNLNMYIRFFRGSKQVLLE